MSIELTFQNFNLLLLPMQDLHECPILRFCPCVFAYVCRLILAWWGAQSRGRARLEQMPAHPAFRQGAPVVRQVVLIFRQGELKLWQGELDSRQGEVGLREGGLVFLRALPGVETTHLPPMQQVCASQNSLLLRCLLRCSRRRCRLLFCILLLSMAAWKMPCDDTPMLCRGGVCQHVAVCCSVLQCFTLRAWKMP